MCIPRPAECVVPVRVEDADSFDPFEVPTVEQLERELDEAGSLGGSGSGGGGGEESVGKGWERTRLRPYIEHFKEFVHGLQEEE